MKKLIVTGLILALVACSSTTETETQTQNIDLIRDASLITNSNLIDVEFINDIAPERADSYLRLLGQAEIKASLSSRLYKVTYLTKLQNDSIITVSGLVALPETESPKSMVVLQNGTNSERDNAPSSGSLSVTLPFSSAFANQGHVLVMADFIGLGESEVTPTYAHIQSNRQAVLDLIEISAEIYEIVYGKSLNELNLAGISAGAQINLAVQSYLDSMDTYPIGQSANVAGPYNLSEIQAKFGVEQDNIFFLGYIANSYSEVYDIDLNMIVKEQFVDTVRKYYSGDYASSEIESALPTSSDEFINDSLLSAIENNTEHPFIELLRLNDTYDYKISSPLTLYYGDSDLTVNPQDTKDTYELMDSKDFDVSLVNLGDYSHVETILNSLGVILDQFE